MMLVLFVVKCILVILMARPSSLAVFDFIHKVNGGLLHSIGACDALEPFLAPS